MREDSKILQKYEASVRLHEQDIINHEHSLADSERDGIIEELAAQAGEHGRESERQEMQRRAHDEIKKKQHLLLSQWKLLYLALISESPRVIHTY